MLVTLQRRHTCFVFAFTRGGKRYLSIIAAADTTILTQSVAHSLEDLLVCLLVLDKRLARFLVTFALLDGVPNHGIPTKAGQNDQAVAHNYGNDVQSHWMDNEDLRTS